jgi:deoxyribonuclease V
MNPTHPEFVPDPADSREAMEALQREIAARARFDDDLGFDPRELSLRVDEALSAGSAGGPEERAEPGGVGENGETGERPVVAGVDQAFLDDRAVSAIVCMQGGEEIERARAVTPLEFPYVPGLLSFREGGPILAAVAELNVRPDLALFDGSGRIHFREAGLAAHMGLALDVPAIGVAKSLLCGTPREHTDDRETGERVTIEADEEVSAPSGTVIGYALQTKQFAGSRYVNPLYVSPGHRVNAATAADLVLALCEEYKLPEPIRRADAYAEEVKRKIE